MAKINCPGFFSDCADFFKHMTFDLFWKWLIAEDSNGCPAVRVTGDITTSPTEFNSVRGYFKNITDNAAHDVLPSAGATLKNYITSILVTNASTTTGTLVDIIEETSGDVLWTGYASKEGGFSISFPDAPLIQLSANKKIIVICTTTGADVTVSIAGYKK